MALTIHSLKRAFKAKQHMALAAGNIDNTVAAIKAKDILECLHLGLCCDEMEVDEYCQSTSDVDEFIASCKNMLSALISENENGIATIELASGKNLVLKEENGSTNMNLDGEHVSLGHLTLEKLYHNLVQDIQHNPDLYGCCLTSFVHSLEEAESLR